MHNYIHPNYQLNFVNRLKIMQINITIHMRKFFINDMSSIRIICINSYLFLVMAIKLVESPKYPCSLYLALAVHGFSEVKFRIR